MVSGCLCLMMLILFWVLLVWVSGLLFVHLLLELLWFVYFMLLHCYVDLGCGCLCLFWVGEYV